MAGLPPARKRPCRSHETALHAAVKYLHYQPKLTQTLLSCGAEVEPRDKDNKTPLLIACGPVQKQRGFTSLTKEAEERYEQHDRLNMIRLLIRNGADIHAQDNAGNTPLSLQNKLCSITATELKEEREFVNACFTFLGRHNAKEHDAASRKTTIDDLPLEIRKEICLYSAPNHRKQQGIEKIETQFNIIAERRARYFPR